MSKSLWFCVPAHGRVDLARICLRQLRRTCDALIAEGVEARAFVVADDENLDTARDLGFGYVERDNTFVSRKYNDGIQYALDPAYNPHPADYVVPCGSDDWVDHRLFLDLPARNTMVGFRHIAFVREDGAEINTTVLDRTLGGCGIRIYPRQLLEPLGYRPAAEDYRRACDTSILSNVMRHWEHRMRIDHRHLHDHQIVDWKSAGQQLNTYDEIARVHRRTVGGDPFATLAGVYPGEALQEMRAHYGRAAQVAA